MSRERGAVELMAGASPVSNSCSRRAVRVPQTGTVLAARSHLAVPSCALLPVLLAILLSTGPLQAGSFLEARSYFRQGRYEKVLQVIDELPAISPELLLMKGESLAQLGRLDEAAAVFDAVMESYSGTTQALRARDRLLGVLEDSKNFAALTELLRKLLESDPSPDSRWRRELASAHQRTGQTTQAIQVLEEGHSVADFEMLYEVLLEARAVRAYLDRAPAEARPDDPSAQLRLGVLFLQARDYASARQHLERAPPSEAVFKKLIDVARATGDDALAVRCYQKLLSMDPRNGVYYQKLGELYLRQGKPHLAGRTWRSILDVEGRKPDTFAWVARVFLEHDLSEPALEVIRSARGATRNSSLLFEEAAKAHVTAGRPAEAAREYLRVVPTSFEKARDSLVVLAADPAMRAPVLQTVLEAARSYTSLPEYSLLAIDLLAPDGFGDTARAVLSRLCESFARTPHELLGVSQDLAGSGHLEASRFVLERVAEQTTGGERWEALHQLARTDRELGQPERALSILTGLLEEALPAPLAIRARELRADLLRQDLGRYAEAMGVYERLLRENPAASSRAKWSLELGRCRLNTQDYAGARKVLTSLVSGGNTEIVLEARYSLACLDCIEGRFDEALEELTWVSLHGARSPVANDALERVLFLSTHPPGEGDGAVTLRRYFLLEHLLSVGDDETYRKTLALIDPESVPPALNDDFLWLSARAHTQRGEARDAVRVLTTLLETHPESPLAPEAMLQSADLEAGPLGQPARALATLREYLLTYPESVALEDIRKTIATLENPP